jgi:glycosyltransferase involved in cell wall biosynthesis
MFFCFTTHFYRSANSDNAKIIMFRKQVRGSELFYKAKRKLNILSRIIEMKIIAAVVTYNRKTLLLRCLEAFVAQTRKPDLILIVDNASTDGTYETLSENEWLSKPDVRLIRLPENTGGAGGFARILEEVAVDENTWVWMMDDDAIPESSALKELLEIIKDTKNIYGSLAVNGEFCAWKHHLVEQNNKPVLRVEEMPPVAQVQFLPFLGIMVHTDLVKRIGLPDSGFFIAADDVEYCMRAEHAGAKIICAGKSHIEHPKADLYIANILGVKVNCLRLPPWKRYYDTRNRLLVARRYYGVKLLTRTIPGSFVRLFACLLNEPHRLAQTHAFFAGFMDGLLGLKGCRHKKWGINT